MNTFLTSYAQKTVQYCSCTYQLQTNLYSYLAGHDALLVVLSKVSDKVQQFVPLLLAGVHPATLKATKQMVQLLREEVPCKLD